MSNEITAVLLNCRRDGNRVSGNCYCDRKGRFRDGEIVTTSAILEELSPAKEFLPLLITKNSIYKVGSWA